MKNIWALENLKKSVEKGFNDKTWIETEELLDKIRTDSRYLEIVNSIQL